MDAPSGACRDVLWASGQLGFSHKSRLPGRERILDVLRRSRRLASGDPDPWKIAIRYLVSENHALTLPSCHTKLVRGTVCALYMDLFGEPLTASRALVEMRRPGGSAAYVTLSGADAEAAVRLSERGDYDLPIALADLVRRGPGGVRDEMWVISACFEAVRAGNESSESHSEPCLSMPPTALSDVLVDAIAVASIFAV